MKKNKKKIKFKCKFINNEYFAKKIDEVRLFEFNIKLYMFTLTTLLNFYIFKL